MIKLFTSNIIENSILKLPEIISNPIISVINGYKIKLKNPDMEDTSGIGIISFIWNTGIIILVLYFIKSLIETIANKQKNKEN